MLLKLIKLNLYRISISVQDLVVVGIDGIRNKVTIQKNINSNSVQFNISQRMTIQDSVKTILPVKAL